MTTARTHVSKPATGSLPTVIPRRRLSRDLELSPKATTFRYTDEQIDRFCAAVASALAKPDALESMIDRIGELLAKASPSTRPR